MQPDAVHSVTRTEVQNGCPKHHGGDVLQEAVCPAVVTAPSGSAFLSLWPNMASSGRRTPKGPHRVACNLGDMLGRLPSPTPHPTLLPSFSRTSFHPSPISRPHTLRGLLLGLASSERQQTAGATNSGPPGMAEVRTARNRMCTAMQKASKQIKGAISEMSI